MNYLVYLSLARHVYTENPGDMADLIASHKNELAQRLVFGEGFARPANGHPLDGDVRRNLFGGAGLRQRAVRGIDFFGQRDAISDAAVGRKIDF